MSASSAVEDIVRQFYALVLADCDLRGFFDRTDMEIQINRMTRAMLSLVKGQNIDYEKIAVAHENSVSLGLTDFHFDRVWKYLEQVLLSNGTANDIVEALGARLEELRAPILGRR